MRSSTSGADELLELKAMMSGTTSCIFLVDGDMNIISASQEAFRAFELEENALDRPLHEVIAAGPQSKTVLEMFRTAMDSGRPAMKEVHYPSPGILGYRLLRIVPVMQEGRPARAVITVEDTTAQRSSETLNEVLNRVYAAINSTMSFDEIFRRVVETSSKAMNSDATAIAIKEGDKWALRHRYGSLPERALGATLTDQQMRSCFLGQGKCVTGVVDIRKADWVSKEMMGRFNILSFISVPLEVRSEMVGVLIFAFTRPREFSSEEVDFANKLSIAVSLALDNSNLYRDERDRRFLVQTILDNIPAVVILMDGKELSIQWTNRFSDRYKFGDLKGTETRGLTLEDIIPNAGKTGVTDMFRRVALSGQPFYSNEFMLSGLGEKLIYWQGGLIPLRSPGKDHADLLILAVDVTESVTARQRSEELAREAEQERRWLRTILETLPVGAAIVDRSGRVSEINQAGRSLWTAIIGPGLDLTALDSVHAWDPDTGRTMRMEDWGVVRAIYQGETIINDLVAIRGGSGKEMVLMMSCTPMKNPEGGVLGAVVIGQDITRQIDLQREAVDARSRAELYLDLLTHDINNLNTAAMGYLQLMTEKADLEEKFAGWAARSLEALGESSRLIDTIRSIQRVEAGEESLDLIDLDEMLSSVVVERSMIYPKASIELVSRGQHHILANALVKEVFANIVDNAIKHNPGSARVDIRVSTAFEAGQEMHRIDFEDNGPGVPDEAKENIFNRAWRGSTRAAGRGLGLFLARRLVMDFNGQIWVEDRMPGDHTKGAKFVVLLPAMDGGSA